MNDNRPQMKAKKVAIFFSFLFPIIGFILYFVQKNTVKNPDVYLAAALCGIGVRFAMVISGSVN